jgi:hypothetical protein
MNMRSGLRSLSLALAAAALSATAFAGMKTAQQVQIVDGNKFANGELGYVRNTGDTVQYIGCTVTGDNGYCTARNKDGLTRSCSSSVAKWVNTMRAVNADTYLYFKWDASGNCVNIIVDNNSTSAPK